MRKLWTELRRGAVADGPILIGLFAVWVVAVVLLASIGINGLSVPAYLSNLALYFAALFAALIVALATILVRHRPDKPIGFLADAFVRSGFGNRLVRSVPMLAVLVVFLPIFSKLKAAIPRFNPYAWDNAWIDLDRVLHGTDPWRILQPILGYPMVTAAVALFYHLWILLLYLGSIYFCFFHTDRLLRARFFIAYFACWTILGVALATALASAGPCFVGPLFDDHRFDDLMAYLRHANESYPVMVLPVQEELLNSYQSAGTELGRGISAMPSMHVSIAFLFFLAIRKVSELAGHLCGLFVVIVLIGSVHLAYHYAVDGYVAIAVTWLIWLASGPLARRIVRTDGTS